MATEENLEKTAEESSVETPKPSWFWVKNSRGQASATLTFLVVSFFATLIAYVGSMFVKIGPLEMRPFDAGACAAFFIPILTAYLGRRFVEAKYEK